IDAVKDGRSAPLHRSTNGPPPAPDRPPTAALDRTSTGPRPDLDRPSTGPRPALDRPSTGPRPAPTHVRAPSSPVGPSSPPGRRGVEVARGARSGSRPFAVPFGQPCPGRAEPFSSLPSS